MAGWRRRAPGREWALGAAGAAAVLAGTLVPLAGAWGDLWTGAVGIRRAARGVRLDPGALDPSFALGLAGLGIAVLVGAAAALRRDPRGALAGRSHLVALLAAGAALVALQRPLFLHHLALLSVPLALLGASWCRAGSPRRAVPLVAAGVLLLPAAIDGRRLQPTAERARIDRIAALIDAGTAPEATVVSDLPLVPPAAGRPAAAVTIDASLVRVGSGALDRGAVLRAASTSGAVVIGRAFATLPGLDRALAPRFPRVVSVGDVRVRLRGTPPASIP